MLSRDEALAHERKAEVFEVMNELCREDQSIDYFFRRQRTADPSAPLEHRFRYPDEVFALGAERDARVKGANDFLLLDGNRYFLRCLVPFPVDDLGQWSVATWVEVNADDAQRIERVWTKPEYSELTFSGVLSNDFGAISLPIENGTKVDVHVVDAKKLPQVKYAAESMSHDAFERYAVEHNFL